MEVTLTPETQTIIDKKLASGHYETAGEVVDEALRFVEDNHEYVQQKKLEKLRAMIDVGFAQIERGEGIVLEDEAAIEKFFDEIWE